MLKELTGKKHIIIYSDGYGPINRLFSIDKFKSRELSTNLPLNKFFSDNKIIKYNCGEKKNTPVLVCLPLFQINTFIPDLDDIKFNNPSILLMPNPLSIMDLYFYKHKDSLNSFFSKASEFFNVFIFNSILCSRNFGGFIALDDDALAKEFEEIYPLTGEYPDYGTTLDSTAKAILENWNEEKIKNDIGIFIKKKDFSSENSEKKQVLISGHTLTIDNNQIKDCINNKKNYNLFVNSLKLPFAYLLNDYFESSSMGLEIDLRANAELRESLLNNNNSDDFNNNFKINDISKWL